METNTIPAYQKNMVSCFRMANRVGVLPVLGSVVGIIRTTGALLITLFALVILAGKYIATGKTGCSIPHVIKASTAHFVFGILETIPIIGTIVHMKIDSRDEKDASQSSYATQVCSDSTGKPVHGEFSHFLRQTFSRSPVTENKELLK